MFVFFIPSLILIYNGKNKSWLVNVIKRLIYLYNNDYLWEFCKSDEENY